MISESELKSVMRTVYKQVQQNIPWEIDFYNDEGREKTPACCFMWMKCLGKWYPKRCEEQLRSISSLLRDGEKYGKKFHTKRERNDHIIKLLDKSDEQFTTIKCQYCEERFSISQIDNHEQSRRCKTKQAKLLVSETQAECKICNRTFANRYVLQSHLNTKRHRQKEAEFVGKRTIPNHCEVCDKPQPTQLRFRRHLKSGKKCRKICAHDHEKYLMWVSYYKIFNCKFPVLACEDQ
jgi:hypothetical protein